MDFQGHDLSGFNKLDTDAQLRWINDKFPGKSGIGTSFQYSGMILIDSRCRQKLDGIRIYTIDTERLLPETYDFIKLVEKHYKIDIDKVRPNKVEIEKMVQQYGEFLFFDSKQQQEYCCNLRKVKPHEKILDEIDVWVTGLRQVQSKHRSDTPSYEILNHKDRKILKVNPLYNWTDDDIKQRTAENNIPAHPLYEKGFPSFGCVICTTPVLPHEDSRAGRWRWFNSVDEKKECGLHIHDK